VDVGIGEEGASGPGAEVSLSFVLDCFPHQQTEDDRTTHEYDQEIRAF
jgi:hypothetical protein